MKPVELCQARTGREKPLDCRKPDPEPLSLIACLVMPRACLFQLLAQLGKPTGLGVDPVALGPEFGKFGLEFAQDAFLGAGLVEVLRFSADPDQPLGEIPQTGAGRKQQFAQVATAGEDAFTALLKALVIERKHGLVAVAVEPAKTCQQRAVGDGLIAVVEQAVLLPLDTGEFLGLSIDLHAGADAHVGVGVEEIVAALRANPEQQVEPGTEQRRFSRLVRAVDNVQVATAGGGRAKIDPVIGELAVAGEVEAIEAHQAVSLPAAWPGCSRASTSSAPWRASSRRRALVSASSVPNRSRRSVGSCACKVSATLASAVS